MSPKDVSILVVDDEADLRDSVSALFKAYGFKVMTASNGQEALDSHNKQPAHIVLTDIRMPVMDGVQLITTLKTKNPNTPVVLCMSGFTDFGAENLLAVGADGFFAKPFNAERVKEAIRLSLTKKQDRWRNPPGKTPKYRADKKFPSAEKLQQSGEVKFGRQGLFLSYKFELPPIGELMSFSVKVGAGLPWKELKGVGTVQWTRAEDKDKSLRGVGLEITYLEPESLELYATWLESQQIVPAIPS